MVTPGINWLLVGVIVGCSFQQSIEKRIHTFSVDFTGEYSIYWSEPETIGVVFKVMNKSDTSVEFDLYSKRQYYAQEKMRTGFYMSYLNKEIPLVTVKDDIQIASNSETLIFTEVSFDNYSDIESIFMGYSIDETNVHLLEKVTFYYRDEKGQDSLVDGNSFKMNASYYDKEITSIVNKVE